MDLSPRPFLLPRLWPAVSCQGWTPAWPSLTQGVGTRVACLSCLPHGCQPKHANAHVTQKPLKVVGRLWLGPGHGSSSEGARGPNKTISSQFQRGLLNMLIIKKTPGRATAVPALLGCQHSPGAGPRTGIRRGAESTARGWDGGSGGHDFVFPRSEQPCKFNKPARSEIY